MSQTRQLAAIMFTDSVGYTTLMGKDEVKAFAILDKNRAIRLPIRDSGSFVSHHIAKQNVSNDARHPTEVCVKKAVDNTLNKEKANEKVDHRVVDYFHPRFRARKSRRGIGLRK